MKIVAIEQTEQIEQQEMPSNFPFWLHEQIKIFTNNYTKALTETEQKEIDLVEQWAEAIKPNLMGLGFPAAYNFALQWRNQNLSKQYKTNNVVFTWKDGWRMVELPLPTYSSKSPAEESQNDIDIERELMAMGDEVDEKKIYSTLYNVSNYLQNDDLPSKDTSALLYSLRDPENMPRATIELRYNDKRPNLLYVHEIFANEELTQNPDSWQISHLHPKRNYIKDFFNYLKSQGYRFSAIESDSDDIKAHQLEDRDQEDQFGIPLELWGVGGSAGNYYDSLQEAYNAGGNRYWSKHKAENVVDSLISYAEARGELGELEKAFEGHSVEERDKDGKMGKKWESIQEWANEAWLEQESNIHYQHPYPGDEPDPEDFTMQPQITEEQSELKGMPQPTKVLNQQAYEEAKKQYDEEMAAHEAERESYENEFEPTQFQNYVYDAIQKAKARQSKVPVPPLKKAENMKTTITKIANKKLNEKLPDGEQMALYALTLKQYLEDNPNISKEWADLIEKLPAPRQIRQDFSFQELKLLYETLEYLWSKVTGGQKIIPEKEIVSKPETLTGNYLMMSNGILLEGLNTYDIIKRNAQLICSLLNISGMTLQERLAGKPNDLIKFILKAGAMRLFITKDKRFFVQVSPEIFGKWAKKKIQKLDFRKKVVKLIDFKAEYKGWKSGISVIL